MTSRTAPPVKVVTSRRDPSLTARIVSRLPLRYSDGADPTVERPPHVRAGSGLAWVGESLAIVQDDANHIALVDPRTARVTPLTLGAGPGGARLFDDARGNKADKLDLETILCVDDDGAGAVLIAFGSGSTGQREHVVTVSGIDQALHGTSPTVHTVHAEGLYLALHAASAFSGAELNVEGAALEGTSAARMLHLFNRGNGAGRDGDRAVNASCELPWDAVRAYLERVDRRIPPLPRSVVQYELGTVGGQPLAFTDVTTRSRDEESVAAVMLYVAAAEDSPDATRDGAVAGSAIGCIVRVGEARTAAWTPLLTESGAIFAGKAEGIALAPRDPGRVYVVVDSDASDVPSELCEVVLEGPWP